MSKQYIKLPDWDSSARHFAWTKCSACEQAIPKTARDGRTWVFTGSRVPLRVFFESLADGQGIAEFCREHAVERNKVECVIQFSAMQAKDATFNAPDRLHGEEDIMGMISEMRNWEGPDAVSRTLLLVAHLGRIGGHRALKLWLERPNMVFGGDAPRDAIFRGRWQDVANLADEMLTGFAASTSESEPK